MNIVELSQSAKDLFDVTEEAIKYVRAESDYFSVSKGGWEITFDLQKQKGGAK